MPVESRSLTKTTIPMLSDPDGETAAISIDVDRLVETRLLVQANSGGGKSYLLRRLLEQTWGKVQHIVIDVEGEFHTLRASYDYVLCAPRGADCVADTRSAALLARRLLELGASAIIDIYELGVTQKRFVKLFLESLMSAPRDLWHSALVVVDEAHKFCAEKEEAESAAAVIDLMTRGRKRGFAGVLATQRLSKLDKDAAAEANNVLIGRTSLDLDVARAALVLGMPIKEARATLPKLAPGEFFCVGPALSPTVERVHIGHVQTSHPKAGSRGAPPAPPRETIRKVLAKLADLPAEAEEEVKTVAELRKRVRELEAEVSRDGMVDTRPRVIDELKTTVGDLGRSRENLYKEYLALDERTNKLEKRVIETEYERDEAQEMDRLNNDALDQVVHKLEAIVSELQVRPGPRPVQRTPPQVQQVRRFVDGHSSPPLFITDVKRAWVDNDYGNLTAIQRAMLVVLAQRGQKNGVAIPIPKNKILIWSGYARGGTTSKAFAELVKNGWVKPDGSGLMITNPGLRALGAYEELPTGRALRDRIRGGLADLERKIFEVVCDSYPDSITKHDVLSATGYARGGTTSKAFAYLTAREYVIADGPGRLRAAQELFS